MMIVKIKVFDIRAQNWLPAFTTLGLSASAGQDS